MFRRSVLLISVVTVACLTAPLSADSTSTTNSPTITRTFVFPAMGGASSETIRIAVLNIAQAAHNGTKASCTGTIAFANPAGTQLSSTPFTVGTGDIQVADLPLGAPGAPAGGRTEVQGSVTLNVTNVPCSLLLTLENFDSNSGVTHAVVTTAVEEPAVITPVSRGKD